MKIKKPKKPRFFKMGLDSPDKFTNLQLIICSQQGRSKVFWRPGQGVGLAPPSPHCLLGLMPQLSRALGLAHLHTLSKHLISIRGIVKMPCQSLLMTFTCLE